MLRSITQKIKNTTYLQFLLAFVGFFILRYVPERYIGQTPVGFDTSSPYLETYNSYSDSFFGSITHFNLLYYIFSVASKLGIEAMPFIKIASPLLFAWFCLCFLLLLKIAFKANSRVLLISVFLFSLQLSTLRFSWDLLRNELGLIFALLTICFTVLYSQNKKPYLLGVILLTGILTVASHQIVGFLLAEIGVIALLVWVIKRYASKKVTLPLYVLFALFILIGWPLLAQHISFGQFSLWSHNPAPLPFERRMPLYLASLLFSPLFAICIVIGLKIQRSALLFLASLAIFIQSFTTVFLRDQGFFLWDRWMYFLGIPFTIYAVYGLKKLVETIIVPRYALLGYIFFIGLLSYPAYQFLVPNQTLYGRKINPAIFNIFPASMTTNAFMANPFEVEQAKDIAPCVEKIAKLHNGRSIIVYEPKHVGIFLIKASSIIGFVTTNPQIVPLAKPYYLFSYTAKDGNPLPLHPDAAGCPIYYGLKQ